MLWNTYTPLLTYKHQKGDAGTEVVPGLAKDMPEISADGKTYKLTLRPNMKYSDGTPIKASDFTYAIKRLFKANSGGSVFYEGIVGATDFADGKSDTISGINTDDNTGDITIQLEKPNGTFNNVLGADVRRAGAAEHAAGQGRHQQPAAVERAVRHHQGQRAQYPDAGTQSAVQDGQGRRRHPRCADAQVDKIIVTQNKNNSAQVTGVAAEQDRLHDRPAGRRPAAGDQGQVRRPVPVRGLDQHLLLLDEHPDGAVQRRQGAPGHQLRDRPRGAQPGVRRPPAPDPADPAARACPATTSTSCTPDRTWRRPKR